MTTKKAYQILGLTPEDKPAEIKKRYRQLMIQVHPDEAAFSRDGYQYSAQELNLAYSFLKERGFPKPEGHKQTSAPKAKVSWNAPENPAAYRAREILHYVQTPDGSILGNFSIAKGKYLWKPEEDFPLFLLSLYRCGKELLDEIDSLLLRGEVSAARTFIQPELTYLLARQFLDGTALLRELARDVSAKNSDQKIFYIKATLESVLYHQKSAKISDDKTKKSRQKKTDRLSSPAEGTLLYPSRILEHRLYVKELEGLEIGYLSFPDDRMYYVLIPLFEDKQVQIKIQVAEQPDSSQKTDIAKGGKKASKKRLPPCQNLHLWVKLLPNRKAMPPKALNQEIERLLKAYRKAAF